MKILQFIVNSLSYYKIAWKSALLIYLLLQLTRLFTLSFSTSLSIEQINILPILFYGVLTDLLVASCFLSFFSFVYIFYSKKQIQNKQALTHMYRQSTIIVSIIILFLICQIAFFGIYGTQISPNALLNLLDPIPVLKNILELFPILEIIISIIAFAVISSILINRKTQNSVLIMPTTTSKLFGIVIIFTVNLSIWSVVHALSFDMVPKGIQKELSTNSFYSLTQASKISWNYKENYASIDDQQVINILKSDHDVSHKKQGLELLEREVNNHKFKINSDKKLNVVMIMIESFSVNLDGITPDNSNIVAPKFSKIAKKGHYYSNIYATGQSTSRALSSLFYSVPPLPSVPLLFNDNHKKLISLASILKQSDYKTSFIYGGDATFNERDSLIANSNHFDKSIDRNSYTNLPDDANSAWGIHDEYVFERAIKEINKQTEKPFFSTILTLSNHSPYSLPKHFNQLKDLSKRENAIQYSDYSLNKFFEAARQEDWFDDTIFIVVADHGPYRPLNPTFPLVDYKIPVLFYSPKHIRPAINETVASELDIAPTLLAKLGVNYTSRFYGKNIDQKNSTHPVFLTKFDNMGVLIDDTLVQFYPGNIINTWKTTDRVNFEAIEANKKDKNVLKAISYLQGFSRSIINYN